MVPGRLPRRAKSDPAFYGARPLELLSRTALLSIFQSNACIPSTLDTVLSNSQSSSSTSSTPRAEPSDWLSKSSFPSNGSTICTTVAVPSNLRYPLYSNPHPTGPVDIPLPNAQLKDSLARRPTFPSPESQSSIGYSRAANGYNTSASGSADIPLPSPGLRDPIACRPSSVSPESQAERDSRSTNRYNTSVSASVNNPFHSTRSTALPTDHQLFPQTSRPSTNSTASACTSASASVSRKNPVVNAESQALDGELDDTSNNLEVGSETESPTNRMPPSPPEPISSTRTDETISSDGSDDTIILKSDRYYRQYLVDARQRLERVLKRVMEPDLDPKYKRQENCFKARSSRAELARYREYKPSPLSTLPCVSEESCLILFCWWEF